MWPEPVLRTLVRLAIGLLLIVVASDPLQAEQIADTSYLSDLIARSLDDLPSKFPTMFK